MSEERLRILRVLTRINVGGPAIHVALLTRYTDLERFEPLVVAGIPAREEGDMLSLRPDLASALDGKLVLVKALKRAPKPIADLIALRELSTLIARFRPHIVETHMTKAGTLARLAAIRHRVPIRIHVFHGTPFAGHFSTIVGRSIAVWERVLARWTDVAVAVSPAVAADLSARRIRPDEIRMVPYGLELAPFRSVPPLGDDPPKVVTLVARLAPVKDVPLFLEAVSILKKRMPDISAQIAGDGPLRNQLERDAPPWVKFLGFQADIPGVLSGSAAVALTSQSEGSPFVLIEALAAARPVVAVPVGGVVDMLRDRPGALMTRDRSAAEIAMCLERALMDASVRAAAVAARDEVVAEFGAERMTRDMERIYEARWMRYNETR